MAIAIETKKIYANKGRQYVGTVPEAGNLYGEGSWCAVVGQRLFRVGERGMPEALGLRRRMLTTNSHGHPLGTQYTPNAAGGYDKID